MGTGCPLVGYILVGAVDVQAAAGQLRLVADEDAVANLERRVGAEVAAAWAKVVVIQMPDHGRPGVVHHPLDHPGDTH